MLSVYSQLPFVLLVTLFILGCTEDSSVAFDISSEQISDKLAKQAKSGRYVFEDGSLYEGELVLGLPDGYGVITYFSGDVYEGQFIKGSPTGYGTIRYKSIEGLVKYSGNWESGQRSGFGALTMADQSVLEGHWEQDSLKYGEFRDASGNISYGKWQNNRLSEGNLFLSNGDQFSGAFNKDGSYDYGTLSTVSGTIYFGEFEKGSFDGKGVFIDEEGIQYTGGFAEGVKSGMGILKDLDGSIYSGEFLGGLPHGQGRQSDLSGVTYVGSWEFGKKQGNGVLDFNDGTSFVGEFEDGLAVDGIYQWDDGTTSRSFQDENGAWQDFEE